VQLRESSKLTGMDRIVRIKKRAKMKEMLSFFFILTILSILFEFGFNYSELDGEETVWRLTRRFF
jgi:hypothetical protein